MFVIPLLVIVGLGVALYALAHRHPHAVGAAVPDGLVSAPRGFFWPTSTYGRLGTGALALVILMMGLVNVIQVPFLQWFLVLASAILTGLARFRSHDRSTSVLIAFVVSTVAAVAAALFLAGEVFIGHD